MKDTLRPVLPLLGNDRPAWLDQPNAERRPDVLLAMLFDLVYIEIAHLPPIALHDWFRAVGLLLDLLPTEEKRRVWGEMVADYIVRQFPNMSGGLTACRDQICCMRAHGRQWWESWKRQEAPAPALPPSSNLNPQAASGPSEANP